MESWLVGKHWECGLEWERLSFHARVDSSKVDIVHDKLYIYIYIYTF